MRPSALRNTRWSPDVRKWRQPAFSSVLITSRTFSGILLEDKSQRPEVPPIFPRKFLRIPQPSSHYPYRPSPPLVGSPRALLTKRAPMTALPDPVPTRARLLPSKPLIPHGLREISFVPPNCFLRVSLSFLRALRVKIRGAEPWTNPPVPSNLPTTPPAPIRPNSSSPRTPPNQPPQPPALQYL